MLEDANKQVVLQYVEAFNRGDMMRLQNYSPPDALIFGVLGWGEIDKAALIWQELHDSFSINHSS
jgi:hypothetical protein